MHYCFNTETFYLHSNPHTPPNTHTHLWFYGLQVFVGHFPWTQSLELLYVSSGLFLTQPEGGDGFLISLQTTGTERKKTTRARRCIFKYVYLWERLHVSHFFARGALSTSVITTMSSISSRNLFNSIFILQRWTGLKNHHFCTSKLEMWLQKWWSTHSLRSSSMVSRPPKINTLSLLFFQRFLLVNKYGTKRVRPEREQWSFTMRKQNMEIIFKTTFK